MIKRIIITLCFALLLILCCSCKQQSQSNTDQSTAEPTDTHNNSSAPTLKASTQKDIYFLGDNCFKSIGQYDERSVSNFTNKILSIKDNHLADVKSIHYSIIPDKLYYADKQGTITDYKTLFETAVSQLSSLDYIDLRDTLCLSDYHLSDHHWKQENILKVAQKLGESMDFSILDNYEINVFSPYTGTYAPYYEEGTLPNETLCYLEDDYTKSAIVESFDNPNDTAVYNTQKLNEKTPYNMYLQGPSALVKITSQNTSGRKLILFGDSFSSSLAPILMQVYSEITIVDLRYMHSSLLGDYVSFDENSEVLFLYCSNIVNSSYMLK